MTDTLVSPQQLAEYLGIPLKSVRNWRTTGSGPRGIRVGKHVRYRWSDVEAWLERQADQPRQGAA